MAILITMIFWLKHRRQWEFYRETTHKDHVFIFDNATTHLKRAEDALSARKMPKFTPKEGMNWGVEVTMKASDGSIVYDEKGKPRKMKIRMCNGKFLDGRTQEFYFPEGHPRDGIFKGMAQILRERGYTDAHALRAECPKFKSGFCNWTVITRDLVQGEELPGAFPPKVSL
ncbi:hypothetical protein F5879DRAFT_996902 [Lentinula edodes]|nr:hypothetical protein F5879DRAFT_996902 [Lentinula edodes]